MPAQPIDALAAPTTPASTAAAPTRVLIVDDHTTFAELLTGALDRETDLTSIGFAVSIETGVERCRLLAPDLVILDYHLPDGSGLTAAAQILAFAPQTRIVMLTGDPTPDALEQAAATGICGFLPKDGSLATVLDTLRRVRVGSMVVHPAVLAQLGARRRVQTPSVQAPSLRASSLPASGLRASSVPVPVLTPREMDVLRLMARGQDVRTNAAVLGISQHTCRGHVKTILAKLAAHSQLEAVVTASRLGLLISRANV